MKRLKVLISALTLTSAMISSIITSSWALAEIGQHTVGLIHGSNVTAGIVGGIDGSSSNFDDIKATGINSTSGGTSNPDVAADDTLLSFGKTVLTTAGVSEDRADVRVPDGKIIRSVFS